MADLTFLDVPAASIHQLPALRPVAVVLGVPLGVAYPRPGVTAGCAGGPAAIRSRSVRLARFRGHHDFDLDGPMLPVDGPAIFDVGDADGPAAAEAAVRAILAAGAVPLVLGGDDSVPIPVLRAFGAHGPLTVLQVDAHLDFRDEVDGVRDGYSSPMRRAAEMSHVERILQVGLRGVGSARPADVADARGAGNLLVTAADLRRRGVPAVVDRVPAGASVFVSFDLDGLDPAVAPAVSAPAPGGLTWDEARELLSGVASRGRLAGAAITEYVPELDRGDLTALAATRLAILLLAGTRPLTSSSRQRET